MPTWLYNTDERIERAGAIAAVLFLISLPCLALATAFNWQMGVLSGMAGLFTGASWGCLKSYRTERGVWMLASLCATFAVAMWSLFVLADILPRLRGKVPSPPGLLLDGALATAIWAFSVRLSVSVLRSNIKAFKGPVGRTRARGPFPLE